MNETYLEAVNTIKEAILRSQSRAARNTNAEMLSLYYSIGGYISDNSRKGTWGIELNPLRRNLFCRI